MTSLPLRKQIYMEGGYMLDRIQNMNWGVIGVMLGTIAIWYFLISYPITTILTIVGLAVIAALILRYYERI